VTAEHSIHTSYRFGPGLSASLACANNDVYPQFTYVTHTIISAPIRINASRVEALSRVSFLANCQGLHCPPGFGQNHY